MNRNFQAIRESAAFDGLSLILPVYNEEKCLFDVATKLISYCERLKPLCYELIIVDDGSTDGTADVIKQLTESCPGKVIVVLSSRNHGYGYSIRQGISRSRYGFVFFTDSDGQFHIQNLDLLIPLIKTGVPDIVVGYRIDRKDPWIRLFLSGCYNVIVRLLFGIGVKDVDCAFKLFRKDIFDKVKITSNLFFVNTEILAKAAFYGYRILEVGVDHLPRSAGKSTVNIWHIPHTIRELTRIWFEVQKLKKKKS